MFYIGIDPGKSGAIAIIDGSTGVILTSVFGEIAYRGMLEQVDPAHSVCCLEHVGARPGQGVTSMFNFGENFGFIRGLLLAFGIPYQTVTPSKWKREFSVTKDKGSSITACQRLFPRVSLLANERCRVPHDGIAEALLLAEYARRKFGGIDDETRFPF